MAYVASPAATCTLPSGTATVDVTLDLGSFGANPVVVIGHYFRENLGTVITGVTLDPAGDNIALTAGTLANGFMNARIWHGTPQTTGSQTVRIACSTGSGTTSGQIQAWVYDGLDIASYAETAPVTVSTPANGTSGIDVAGAVGDVAVAFHNIRTGYPSPTTIGSDTFDVRNVSNNASNLTIACGDKVIATNPEPMDITWSGNVGTESTYVLGASFDTAAAGPTITQQPVADTGLINGDAARRTTVYVCEASSADGGGVTAMAWEEDGSPISDGGIYDIQNTGIGTANATSTLTITRTVKTGTPFDITPFATDANGTTEGDTVTDTWYTGPVLSDSSGTTNASGVDTVDIVSDYPNADGEFTVVTATAGSVSKTVSLHYEVP